MKEESVKNYGIVLLAAGTSSRLGMPKQLLEYKGETLLNKAIREAKETEVHAIVVVLGAEAHTLKESIKDQDVDFEFNERYTEGMASSIRCGVDYLLKHYPSIENVIFMACDQPHVDAAHLLALMDRHFLTGAGIVASEYAEKKGVPALFNKIFFEELTMLKGDIGARKMMEIHATDTVGVPFPRGVVDVDTMEAYRKLKNHD